MSNSVASGLESNKLPIPSLVAFAARCAERMLPLHSFATGYQPLLDALDQAYSFAAGEELDHTECALLAGEVGVHLAWPTCLMLGAVKGNCGQDLVEKLFEQADKLVEAGCDLSRDPAQSSVHNVSAAIARNDFTTAYALIADAVQSAKLEARP